jgi:hypothetical protein
MAVNSFVPPFREATFCVVPPCVFDKSGCAAMCLWQIRVCRGWRKIAERYSEVKFRVFTAASMKMAVFWVVAPCSLVEVYWRFRGSCCLHHQGTHRSDVGKILPDYMAQQPRRQPSSDSPKVCDDGWFITGELCWSLSIFWGLFDIHDVSGVYSTPVFRWLVVMILTLLYYYYYYY